MTITEENSGVKFTSRLTFTTGGTRDGKWTGEKLSAKALPNKLSPTCVWMSLLANLTMGPRLEFTKRTGVTINVGESKVDKPKRKGVKNEM